jgi:mannose-1-phosphate guanylyltransferase
MKAIIVAGGRGERLRPLTDKIPKPMVTIGGKPLLEHTIELLKQNGIQEFVLAVRYLPEVIEEYFGDGKKFGVKISYIHENLDMPMGTAGAILAAQKNIDGDFLVTYADILRDLDIKKMIELHSKNQSIATIHTYKHSGNNYKSFLEFDKENVLINFTELPKSMKLEGGFKWSNGSLYIFKSSIFKYIKPGDDFSHDVFPLLLKSGEKISVFPGEGYFLDIGTKESLEEAQKHFEK